MLRKWVEIEVIDGLSCKIENHCRDGEDANVRQVVKKCHGRQASIGTQHEND